jgi:hypothetical protein
VQCICQILCSLSADFISAKIQRCECLCAMKMVNIYSRWISDFLAHLVHLQRFRQIVCSFIADVISGKIQCCQCLSGEWRWWKWNRWIEKLFTLFICNAFAKSFVPSLPILLSVRFSIVSVCIEWRWWMNRKMISLCLFAMHLLNISPLQHRVCCWWDQALWVSASKNDDEYIISQLKIYVSPCLFAMHSPNLVLLYDRLYSSRDPVLWAPVWIKESELVIDEQKSYRTVFTSNAFAKYFVASSSSPFALRCNSLSVCIAWRWWISYERIRNICLTIFIFNIFDK